MRKLCDDSVDFLQDVGWNHAVPVSGDKSYSIEQKKGGEYSCRQEQDGVFLFAW